MTYKELENKKNVIGGYSGKINGKHIINIYPLHKNLLKSDNSIYFSEALITFAHEIFHMKQKLDIEFEKFDYLTIVYCLENILQNNIPGFYDMHYSDLVCEITADGFGTIVTADFLKKLIPLYLRAYNCYEFRQIIENLPFLCCNFNDFKKELIEMNENKTNINWLITIYLTLH